MKEMEEAYYIVTDDNQIMFTSFATCEEAYAYLESDEFTDEEREHLHVEVY